jgi:hypothetical protein
MINSGLTLGALIDALASVSTPDGYRVRYEFCGCVPDGLHSYRGYYEDLAIGFSDEKSAPKHDEVLTMLCETVGEVFMGYKGGKYRMSRESTLWVANYGNTSGTHIKAVRLDRENDTIWLVTGRD